MLLLTLASYLIKAHPAAAALILAMAMTIMAKVHAPYSRVVFECVIIEIKNKTFYIDSTNLGFHTSNF